MGQKGLSVNRRDYIRVVGGASAIGLAGCTSGIGGGGTDETIKIAATVPLTGPFSTSGKQMKRGYELGVDRINDEGGIDGREVELLLEDDGSDPKQVREKLTEITSSDDIAMIWGSFTSLLTTAGSAFAESQGTPFLAISFAYEKPHREKSFEWTYAPFPKTRDIVAATQRLLDSIPGGDRPSNVAIAELNSGWGSEMANGWEDSLSGAGYEVVAREKYSRGTKDFSTIISKFESGGAEAVIGNPIPPDGITLVKQMKSAGFAPTVSMLVRAAAPQAWGAALGADGNYATFTPGWLPALTSNGNEAFKSSYADSVEDASGQIPVNVGTSYNLAQVAGQALADAGSTDSGELQASLDGSQFETIIGSFGFDEYGMPAEGDLICPVAQWQDGKQRLVTPTDHENAMDLQYPVQWG